MTLEEFYKDNKKVKVFNCFTHINNNEIYKVEYDDEGTMTLFSKKARDQGWDIISEEVFEFTYIDDGRIIYRDLDYYYDLPTTVYVSFTNEEDFSVGALTKYGLVYVKDDKFVVIEDPNQNKKIIHICGEGEYDDEPSYGVSPSYSEDFFSITYHYPHSTFYFYNTYDYEGNLLKEKFQADFEDIILYYTFAYKLKTDIDIDCITDEQIDLYNKLAEIRNDGNSDFKSKLEKSLKILKEADSLNTKEVKKYLRIIALLNKYSIVNLSLAMLNIMVINQSGEFGRKNDFCSLKNSKIIDRMGKVYGKEFEKILTDINLFWINTKIFYMAEHSKKKR